MDPLLQEMIQTRISLITSRCFHHIACFFLRKSIIRLSMGINGIQKRGSYHNSIHAEVDALRKLPNPIKHGSLKKINLLVIRITKTGKLCMSKPCKNCIRRMIQMAPQKGYRIQWIYYSTASGTIDKIKWNHLQEKEGFGLDRRLNLRS